MTFVHHRLRIACSGSLATGMDPLTRSEKL